MISDYHGKRTRSRAMGIFQTSVYAGTVGGGYLAGAIAQKHGWRAPILVFGATRLSWWSGSDSPAARACRGVAQTRNSVRTSLRTPPQPAPALSLSSVRSLLKIRSLLTLTAVFACANFVAMVLLAWMPTYLYSRFHLSLSMAAFDAAVYPQIASMGGSVFGGYLADKFAQTTPQAALLVQCVGDIGRRAIRHSSAASADL